MSALLADKEQGTNTCVLATQRGPVVKVLAIFPIRRLAFKQHLTSQLVWHIVFGHESGRYMKTVKIQRKKS